MEKKILIVVCILVIVVGYFVAGYQDDKRKEKNQEMAVVEREREIAIQDSMDAMVPFNALLEKEMMSYMETASKELGKNNKARRLYYLTMRKDNGKDQLIMTTGYSFNQDKIEGFTRLNENIIIYYGNPDNIDQTLVDESKLNKSFEQLAFYLDQEGDTDKTITWRYDIENKDKLSLASTKN